jgi:hypothetical protein
MYLQVKNAWGNNTKSIFDRMDWTITNSSTLNAVGNPSVSIGVISDNDLIVRAGQVRVLHFLGLNLDVHIQAQKPPLQTLMTTDKRCLTVMKCQRGNEGYCNPQSTEPVETVSQIQLGAYLKILPCVHNGTHPSQQMYQVNHNCSMEKLTNGVCDTPDCDFQVFRNDTGFCTGGVNNNQTQSPSVQEYEDDWSNITSPTSSPVISRSSSPSSEPTLRVNTPSPVTVIEAYYEPSVQPSVSPSVLVQPNNNVNSTTSPTPKPNNNDDDEHRVVFIIAMSLSAVALALSLVSGYLVWKRIRINFH